MTSLKMFMVTSTHYVVVDDSGIKPCQPANVCMAHKTKICDKCGRYNGMIVVKELSLSEVEEAIYGYSVEKMAEHSADDAVFQDTSLDYAGFYKGYITGFNAHKELVKDKLFTGEQIIQAIAFGFGICKQHNRAPFDLEQKEFIQSLLPKTEWDIEFDEQGKLKLKV